ncbi:MAG: isopeptide-forming domain-containing fimbrial protein, partial [Chloroflexi bacterium]|nr:isopeptide-forming domain-containing fimbrial protein [Chloroflexota bacterium]
VVEFNAVVENIAGNQAFNNATGAASATSRSNNFRVRVAGTNIATSNNVSVYIAEPVIRSLSKTVVSPAPTDAGDTVRYRLEYSNTASGNDRAAAFDVIITDTLSSHLDLQSVSIAVPAGSTATDTSILGVGGTVRVSVDILTPTVDIPGVQKSVVITITARVVATAPAGQTIPNTANLTYTSLPGPNGTTANPTGSSTPGASGADTGERNGSNGVGGLNDYVSSANVNTTLATPMIEKLAPSPLFYAVGQHVTYPLRVTLPEGVTRDLVVFDDLPVGMAYVGYQVITST